jgi:hypothetical protein
MYYPDLTPYKYMEGNVEPNTFNVGWLDKKHSYPTDSPSKVFLARLFRLCLDPVNRTRGYHTCALCQQPSFGLEVEREGRELSLGAAEIRVIGKGGKLFAAPDLIYHYVKDHNYKPPDEFIEAVMVQSP